MLKLQEISQIEKMKADVPLYYLNKYKAIAHFLDEGTEPFSCPISFIMEMEASGNKKIEVKIKESINYPLLTVIKIIKQEIVRLDREAKLPC